MHSQQIIYNNFQGVDFKENYFNKTMLFSFYYNELESHFSFSAAWPTITKIVYYLCAVLRGLAEANLRNEFKRISGGYF